MRNFFLKFDLFIHLCLARTVELGVIFVLFWNSISEVTYFYSVALVGWFHVGVSQAEGGVLQPVGQYHVVLTVCHLNVIKPQCFCHPDIKLETLMSFSTE